MGKYLLLLTTGKLIISLVCMLVQSYLDNALLSGAEEHGHAPIIVEYVAYQVMTFTFDTLL